MRSPLVLLALLLTLGFAVGCGGSKSPIVGTWIPAGKDGPIPNAFVTYRANGTMERSLQTESPEGKRSMVTTGRWELKDGKLKTIVEDMVIDGKQLEGLAKVRTVENMNLDNEVQITWNGNDEFSITYGSETIRHTRKK